MTTKSHSVVLTAAAEDEAPEDEMPEAGSSRPFETLMCVEGRWTGDERIIMVDGLSWDGLLPMPLTVDHEGVMEVVGRVDEITRTPGATEDERFIFGKGEFFTGTDLGAQVAELIEAQYVRGVSIETDDVAIGGVDPEDPALQPGQDPGWMMVTESARIRALSVVTTAAFAEAYITFGTLSTLGLPPAIDGPTPLRAEDMPAADEEGIDEVIIVAAGHTIVLPSVPPAGWFAEPTDVAIEGALTVTDEGRVYGLLAPADTPFIGNPNIRGVPMGNVDYSRFMRGEAVVEGGGRVVAGNITMGCGHAKGITSASMMEHHDNSCAVVARVAVGERHSEPRGVWVAGAVLPGTTPDQIQRMMACQLSGEWNPTPSGYELLNALLVPVPAFAMGRRAPSVTARDGKLVASAVPVRFEHEADCGCGDCPEMELGEITLDEGVVAGILARLDALEATTAPLAAQSVESYRSRFAIGDTSETP